MTAWGGRRGESEWENGTGPDEGKRGGVARSAADGVKRAGGAEGT